MSSRLSGDLEEDEEEEEQEESINPSEVKMSQIVMPCHSNHQQELSVGELLKWMDSTACLSGKCLCVIQGTQGEWLNKLSVFYGQLRGMQGVPV